MAGSLERIYWDAGIFIRWLAGITGKPKDLTELEHQAIQEQGRLQAVGELVIVTSVLTRCEVFQDELSEKALAAYQNLRHRPDRFAEIAVDDVICDRAREIRERLGQRLKPKPLTVGTPDAIHLASAQIYRVPRIFTTDKRLIEVPEDLRLGVGVSRPYLNQYVLPPD